MRIAFVSIPHYPCAVEALRNPQLGAKPLIVGDSEQPKRVLDCSASAAAKGVRQDMTIRNALGFCPEAVVVPPDPVLYRSLWESVLDALWDVSPEVEDEELGRAYLNVGGLNALYRDEAEVAGRIVETVRVASGLQARVGIASGKMPAFAAANLNLDGNTYVVPTGSEAAYLAATSIDLLPFDIKVRHRLRLLGLEECGDVARLSLPELQSQFGFEGKRLWQLTNGIDDEPLQPRKRALSLSAGMSFESSIAGIEVMVAVAKQLLARLRQRLGSRGARELTLQATLSNGRGWERHLVFREAVSENERLVFLLRSTLQNAPPPLAVQSLSLCLASLTGETGKQLSLGEKSRLQHDLEECIQQLKVRYGYSPVFRCMDVEPWSVIPEERQILVESDA